MKSYCISIIFDKEQSIDCNTRYNQIISTLKSDAFPIQLIADPINDIDKQFKKGDLYAIISLNKVLKNNIRGSINLAYRVFENNEYTPYKDDYILFEYNKKKIKFNEIISFIKYFVSKNNPFLAKLYSDDISSEDYSRRLYKPRNFLSWIYPIHYLSKEYCEQGLKIPPVQILSLLGDVDLFEKSLFNEGIFLVLKGDYLELDKAKNLDELVRRKLGLFGE